MPFHMSVKTGNTILKKGNLSCKNTCHAETKVLMQGVETLAKTQCRQLFLGANGDHMALGLRKCKGQFEPTNQAMHSDVTSAHCQTQVFTVDTFLLLTEAPWKKVTSADASSPIKPCFSCKRSYCT